MWTVDAGLSADNSMRLILGKSTATDDGTGKITQEEEEKEQDRKLRTWGSHDDVHDVVTLSELQEPLTGFVDGLITRLGENTGCGLSDKLYYYYWRIYQRVRVIGNGQLMIR